MPVSRPQGQGRGEKCGLTPIFLTDAARPVAEGEDPMYDVVDGPTHPILVLGATKRETPGKEQRKRLSGGKLEDPAAYRYVVPNGTAPFIRPTVGATRRPQFRFPGPSMINASAGHDASHWSPHFLHTTVFLLLV